MQYYSDSSPFLSSYILHEKTFTGFYKVSEYHAFLVMRNGKFPLICLSYGVNIFIDLHPILLLLLYLRVLLHLETSHMEAIPYHTTLSLISPTSSDTTFLRWNAELNWHTHIHCGVKE